MANTLVDKIRYRWDRHILRIPCRCDNPYVTHLPILLAMGSWRPIRRVLEFGAGAFSTTTFLNREFFPHLERLDSYENDSAWKDRVQRICKDDSRLTLSLVNGPVFIAAQSIDLDRFDLIFIDDSVDSAQRSSTIRAVSTRRPQLSVVVVHDFECLEYRRAARAFLHGYRFTALNPNTGVLWNRLEISKRWLRRINGLLRELDQQPDLREWMTRLSGTDLRA